MRLIARADLELRSQPPDKRLVLERLVFDLTKESRTAPGDISLQYAMEW
jgi:DNA polymerase-3 subunit delta